MASDSPCYRYKVYRTDKHDLHRLMPTDEFGFVVMVKSRFIGSRRSRCRLKILQDCNLSSIKCESFLFKEEGRDFLRSNLAHPEFPSEWLQQIIPKVISDVQHMFHFNNNVGVGSTPNNSNPHPRVFNFLLNIVLDFPVPDNEEEEEEEEEEPMEEESKQAIKPSITAFTLPRECYICKQKFKSVPNAFDVYANVDSAAKAAIMPCGHLFHPHCIDRWWRIYHTCPSC